jgi:hypothetical protein
MQRVYNTKKLKPNTQVGIIITAFKAMCLTVSLELCG